MKNEDDEHKIEVEYQDGKFTYNEYKCTECGSENIYEVEKNGKRYAICVKCGKVLDL